MKNQKIKSVSKELKRLERMQRNYEREARIQAKVQTKRDEHCIWHLLEGSDSSCSLKPLDEATKKRLGCAFERTECYGSPTACRYKSLHTPQGEYSKEPMEITDWFTKYRRPDWFPSLTHMGHVDTSMANLHHAGAKNVYVRMTGLYYSLEVFVDLPRDPNKQIGLMIEIVNMQPDLCTSTINQTEEHLASVRLLFESPDEKRIGY